MTRTGFALVYVAALLLVLEIALWTVTRFFSSVITRDHYVEYNKELDRAEDELLNFLKKYRRFPDRMELTRADGAKYYLLDDNETQLTDFFHPRNGSPIGYFAPSGVDVCSMGPAQYILETQGDAAPVVYQKPYFMQGYTIGEDRKLSSGITYCKGGFDGAGKCEDNDTIVNDIAFFITHPGENGVFEANIELLDAAKDSGAAVSYSRNNDDVVRYYTYQELFNMFNCNYRLSMKPTFERRTTLGRPRGAQSYNIYTTATAFLPSLTPSNALKAPTPLLPAGGSAVYNDFVGTNTLAAYGDPGLYTGGPSYNGFFVPAAAPGDGFYFNTDYPPYYRTYMVTFEHMRKEEKNNTNPDFSYSTGGRYWESEDLYRDREHDGVPTCVAQCSWTSVFKPHEYATCVYAEGPYGLWGIRGSRSKLDQQPVDWNTDYIESPTQHVTPRTSSLGIRGSAISTMNNCEARVRRDVYHIEFPVNRNGQNFDSESCCLAFDHGDVNVVTNCAVVKGNINGCTASTPGGTLQPGDFPYLKIAASEIPKVKGNRVFRTRDAANNNLRHYTQGKLISDGIRFNMYFDRGNTRYEIHTDTPIVDFMP